MDLAQLTQETINKINESIKASWKAPVDKSMLPEFFKDVTTSAGLQMYNLEAPAKLLLPGSTPFLNRTARVASQGGTSTRWRQITAYAGPAAGTFLAEGVGASKGTMTTSEVLAAYRTWGLGDDVTLQAVASAKNYDDAKAKTITSVLIRLKVEEEINELYANPGASGTEMGYALAAPVFTAAPTVVNSGGGIAAGTTWRVWCMGLTGFGYKHTSTATPPTSFTAFHGAGTINSADLTTTGGASVIKCRVDPLPGAVAYAWWLSSTGTTFAAATTILQVITTTPDVIIADDNGTVAGTGLVATDTSAQTSANACHPSLLSFLVKNGTGTYSKLMASDATNFDGTPLTTNNRGGIAEIDVANRTVMDAAHTSPNLIICSATDQDRINTAATGSSATNITRVNITGDTGGITMNSRTGFLVNSVGGPDQMLLMTPNAVPGTIFGISETVPYTDSNVGNTYEFEMLLDYLELDYSPTRTNPNPSFDIFNYGTFKKYAPFADWWIQGIGT